jgi:transitional endoplasmic reticulum ATPase
MADRQWTFGNVIGYLYVAFAVYTDADLDEAEKKEIFVALSEWLPDESRSNIYAILETSFTWFKEDFSKNDDDNDYVINQVVGIGSFLKDNMDADGCQAVVNDLARIGQADGHYDETEKKWAEIDYDEEKISSEILEKIQITSDDFREALKEVSPSALREVQVQVPNVSWDDVGGLDDLKEELKEAVEWPIKYKDAYDYVDVESPKGILLHGPPGTGKTLIAKALAKMTESNFISIKGPELLSKWVGESEKGVREIFRKARQAAPCIIFLDEVDALVPRRGSGGSDSHVTENVVSQILTEIDGLEELNNVLIIGATNRLDIVDEALLRPGRFDRIIKVPNPDEKARQHIFEIHTKKKPLDSNVKISEIVRITDDFSGAEIAAVANRAAITSLKRYVSGKSKNVKEIKITQQDLIDAVDKVRPQKKEAPIPQSIKQSKY